MSCLIHEPLRCFDRGLSIPSATCPAQPLPHRLQVEAVPVGAPSAPVRRVDVEPDASCPTRNKLRTGDQRSGRSGDLCGQRDRTGLRPVVGHVGDGVRQVRMLSGSGRSACTDAAPHRGSVVPGHEPGPNFASLVNDLETRAFDARPDDTWVYPGHGTTPRSARSARRCRSGEPEVGELTTNAAGSLRCSCS